MSKNCYICNPDGWQPNSKDINFIPDYILIEKLNEILDSGFPDIASIIKVVETYNLYCENIIEIIDNYHIENCHNCTNCKQHIVAKNRWQTPIVPADTEYDSVICYFAGLSGSQFSVLEKLKDCCKEISAINDMIGMENIKREFCKLMKYLALYDPQIKTPMMHMGIYGPPGHGKTEIAKLLGKAFSKSGLLANPDVFVTARRADLIGAYCGHTAKNTTKMFDQARGGVIFIDEIYSLGNPEKRDVFTKECIDTINQLLSERTDTLCIIAGYKDDAQTSFFSYNKGLERRFPFNFTIDKYTEKELCLIFRKLASESNWQLDAGAILPEDLKVKIGEKDYFDNAGGDMENLLVKTAMAHYDNVFLTDDLNILTRRDVLKGLEAYKAGKNTKEEKSHPPFGMYL